MALQIIRRCHIVRFYEKNSAIAFGGASGYRPAGIPADGIPIYSHGD